MYAGMRDLNENVDAVGIHGGDIFSDVRKQFSGIPSLRDRRITPDTQASGMTLFA